MMKSMDAMGVLAENLDDQLVVASLGHTKYELNAHKDRPEHFYMWNAMGMACSMGLGLAMARPDRKVFILDGDGALLMNLSSLPTEALGAPKNLIHVVFDNHQHKMTGGQPTATAAGADFAAIAKGAGFPQVARVETLDAMRAAVQQALVSNGPAFIHVLVEQSPKEGKPPKSPTFIRHRFMDNLGVSA